MKVSEVAAEPAKVVISMVPVEAPGITIATIV